MNILQRHTAQHFGELQHITRSGKVIHKARGAAANSDLGLYANGKRVRQSVNYSAQRKSGMTLLQRVLER